MFAIRIHSEELPAKVQRGKRPPVLLLFPAGESLDSSFVCQAPFCRPLVIIYGHILLQAMNWRIHAHVLMADFPLLVLGNSSSLLNSSLFLLPQFPNAIFPF